jgi:CxxC motif-containing protein (DUF1111 family)
MPAQSRNLALRAIPTPTETTPRSRALVGKPKNKSLEVFAGKAYHVEMGITNELFPEANEEAEYAQVPSDVVQFAMFMRMVAPPTPSTTSPGGSASISRGAQNFNNVGCALCHIPTLQTSSSSMMPSLSQVNANLFYDLLIHHVGTNLADGVSQGSAVGDEFRSAPLWASASASSSRTTGGRRICSMRSKRTRAQVRRPTTSLRTSTN